SLIPGRRGEDVARIWKALIAFIWKNNGQLPISSDLVRADADLPKPLASSQATCEMLTIPMDKGFKSVVYHLRPKQPGKKLAIFHQGHGDVWTGGAAETTVVRRR